MTRPLCIYHGNCADGFTAAWVVNKHFNGEVDFFPGVYQSPPPVVKGREVIFVDFSYKRVVMEKILDMAEMVTIIDHHKSAIEDLQGLPFHTAIFDVERSGALLTWGCYFSQPCDVPHQIPNLVRYVSDRDLWKFELPHSREINAYIFAHEYTFRNWNTLERELDDLFGDCVRAGAAIEKKHHKDVAELVKVTKRFMNIGTFVMPVACVPYTLVSDAGHLMASTDTIAFGAAACYWDTPEGRCFGLRSTEQGPDVSEIAKLYGGGGHKHAAGFRVPFDQLVEKELL